MSSLQLYPAFDDAVGESQTTFRALLKSMSEPGERGSAPEATMQKHPESATIYASTWSVARTLFDYDTCVYLSPALRSENLLKSLQLQTEAKVTGGHASDEKLAMSQANFALITLEEFADLAAYNLGSIEAPHTSCTLIIQVAGFNQGKVLTLSGPGINGQREVQINGLNDHQAGLLTDNHRFYPCGVDFIFCSPSEFLALPRSTQVHNVAQTQGEASCM